MNPKMRIRMLTDFAMTVLLLCQMAYMLVGESAHEWMGAAMFVIFLIHHVLNWRWYRNLIRGRSYSADCGQFYRVSVYAGPHGERDHDVEVCFFIS